MCKTPCSGMGGYFGCMHLDDMLITVKVFMQKNFCLFDKNSIAMGFVFRFYSIHVSASYTALPATSVCITLPFTSQP